MNSVDILLIAIIILQFLFGLRNGTLKEIVKIITLVVAFLLAYFLLPVAVKYIGGLFKVKTSAEQLKVAFAGCFLAFSILTVFTNKLLGLALSMIARVTAKTKASRVVGGFLSACRAALLCGAALIVFQYAFSDHNLAKQIPDSKLAAVMEDIYDRVYKIAEDFIIEKDIKFDNFTPGGGAFSGVKTGIIPHAGDGFNRC